MDDNLVSRVQGAVAGDPLLETWGLSTTPAISYYARPATSGMTGLSRKCRWNFHMRCRNLHSLHPTLPILEPDRRDPDRPELDRPETDRPDRTGLERHPRSRGFPSRIKNLGPCFGTNGHFRRDPDPEPNAVFHGFPIPCILMGSLCSADVAPVWSGRSDSSSGQP